MSTFQEKQQPQKCRYSECYSKSKRYCNIFTEHSKNSRKDENDEEQQRQLRDITPVFCLFSRLISDESKERENEDMKRNENYTYKYNNAINCKYGTSTQPRSRLLQGFCIGALLLVVISSMRMLPCHCALAKIDSITTTTTTTTFSSNNNNNKNDDNKNKMLLQYENVQAENSQLHSQISKLRQSISTLQQEKVSIKERDDETFYKYQLQVDALLQHSKSLERYIQILAQQNLEYRFGGMKSQQQQVDDHVVHDESSMSFSPLPSSSNAIPTTIEIKMEIESYKSKDPTMLLVEDIILEMAPITILPYTIHRFLKKAIDDQVYNGYHLYHYYDDHPPTTMHEEEGHGGTADAHHDSTSNRNDEEKKKVHDNIIYLIQKPNLLFTKNAGGKEQQSQQDNVLPSPPSSHNQQHDDDDEMPLFHEQLFVKIADENLKEVSSSLLVRQGGYKNDNTEKTNSWFDNMVLREGRDTVPYVRGEQKVEERVIGLLCSAIPTAGAASTTADFFIKIIDNSNNKERLVKVDGREQDLCFAKIVHGVETFLELEKKGYHNENMRIRSVSTSIPTI